MSLPSGLAKMCGCCCVCVSVAAAHRCDAQPAVLCVPGGGLFHPTSVFRAQSLAEQTRMSNVWVDDISLVVPPVMFSFRCWCLSFLAGVLVCVARGHHERGLHRFGLRDGLHVDRAGEYRPSFRSDLAL